MKDEITPYDLRQEVKVRSHIEIPMTAAVISFVILLAAGISIGTILPGILESEPEDDVEGSIEGVDVLLLCSLDNVETDDGTYTNVPIPAAFELLFMEGYEQGSLDHLDAQLASYLEFIYNGSSSFNLRVSTGQGWDLEAPDYLIDGGTPEGERSTYTREVLVSTTGKDRTITFTFDIYQKEVV